MEYTFRKGDVMLYDEKDRDKVARVAHQLRVVRKYAGRKYAVIDVEEGAYKTTIPVQQIILDAPRGSRIIHLNGNTLDNRRSNLKITDTSRESANILQRRVGFKCGVHKRREGVFEAWYAPDGLRETIGLYPTVWDARRGLTEALAPYEPGVKR